MRWRLTPAPLTSLDTLRVPAMLPMQLTGFPTLFTRLFGKRLKL